MSLDKQRILSELGSVMNQLQSADCGCLGKLFNGGQGAGCERPMGNPLPTCGGCRRNCCPGHGNGVHYASMPNSGEPFSMNAAGIPGGGMFSEKMRGGMHEGLTGGMHGGINEGMPGGMYGGMHRTMRGHNGLQSNMDGGMMGHGMGGGMRGGMGGGIGGRINSGMPFGGMGRNAPKLYADTYNYLNKTMMQPTMQEVYNDLKSITPENTIASNPLAQQMGLSVPGGNVMNPGKLGGMSGQMPATSMDMSGSVVNPITNQNTPQMGGMGANIVNMMMSSGRGKPTFNNPSQGAAAGEMPLTNAGGSPGQLNVNMGGIPAMEQSNPAAMMHNPTTQYVTQNNMHEAHSMQGNAIPQGNTMPQSNVMPQGNVIQQGDSIQQGGAVSNMSGMMRNMRQPGQQPYCKHTAGVMKFNEMFPGVMQGDLNFDPMAIALQMNPANQKQAAIDTMSKLMNMDSKRGQRALQPSIAGANAAIQQLSPQAGQLPRQPQTTQGQEQMLPGQQQVASPGTAIQPTQQQVYTTHTGAPVMNQQMLQQQNLQQQIQGQEYQQHQMQKQTNPNAGAVIVSEQGDIEGDPNAPQESVPEDKQEIAKEPLYPVDTKMAYNMAPKYNNMRYNTLGQPVNLLPGNVYHTPSPGLPQTIDGTYRPDLQKYGIKNTESKTLLAGNIPLGTNASRSQLKHIYRQYKASHSAVQQNIKPPIAQGGSPSTGNLNAVPAAADIVRMNANAPPVEKIGGDTMENNQINYQQAQMGQGMGQVGDGPLTVTHGEKMQVGGGGGGLTKGKTNGLQDLAFTAYRGAAAWSFHG